MNTNQWSHYKPEWLAHRSTREQKLGNLLAKPNAVDLLVLKDLIEAGKVRPVIERCYQLGELPEAIRYLETGHASGKLVVTIRR